MKAPGTGATIGPNQPREQLKSQRGGKVRFAGQQTRRPAISFNSDLGANHSEPGQLPFPATIPGSRHINVRKWSSALFSQVNAKFSIHQIKCCVDGLVHVVVLISAQTTSEHHVAFLLGKLNVLLVQG